MPSSDQNADIEEIERLCCRSMSKINKTLHNIAKMCDSEEVDKEIEIELNSDIEVEIYGKLMKQKHPQVPIRFVAPVYPREQ